MTPFRSERGVTLIEMSIILVATLAIAGVLAPSLTATVRNTEITRATTDMTVIRDAILQAQTEGRTRFTDDGGTSVGHRIHFLFSDGDIPNVGSTSTWQNPTDDDLNDFLEAHLVFNSFNGGNSYATTGGSAWRGTYMNAPVDPDPWGNRYAVNVQWLGNSGSGNANDVVVFSAGPDEKEDTSDPGNPLVAGGDDLILLVEA